MKEMIRLQAERAAKKATKVLTVTIQLALGRETTERNFKVVFAENAEVDRAEEERKIIGLSMRKYTSIMHMGGTASILESSLSLVTQ